MTASGFSELSVRQLLARRRRLAGGLSDPERTLRGVLLQKGRRCSSEGCHCRRGELHGPSGGLRRSAQHVGFWQLKDGFLFFYVRARTVGRRGQGRAAGWD